MQTSEAINELATALAKAQGQFSAAVKDSENPAFARGNKVSRYADITAVWEAVRKPLSDNGLSAIQEAARVENGVSVSTRLLHASGQWIQFDALTVPIDKQTAQGVGAGVTYARRFALSACLGVVSDFDDDGNMASGKTITDQQAHILMDLINESGADLKKFLAHIEAPTLQGIPAVKFEEARNALDARKKANAAKTNGAH